MYFICNWHRFLFSFIFTGALAKCAAGGRDHTPCCNRRGVPARCISLCRGVLPQAPAECSTFGGNIIQCFEEGKFFSCFSFSLTKCLLDMYSITFYLGA